MSVTAWPALLYKNYTSLLKHLDVETTPMPLSWFLNSKVPGYEGTLWGADPRCDVAKGVLASASAEQPHTLVAVDITDEDKVRQTLSAGPDPDAEPSSLPGR